MRKLFMLFAMLLAIGLTAVAQVTTVKGNVYSLEDDEPIAGASVRVKGRAGVGTSTDINGNFTLKVAPGDKQLEISFIGYEPRTVNISATMKVGLTVKSEMMDEVMVVAFGKQKRESFTGSASVVSGATLSTQQTNNPIEALNGRVTGVQMTEANGFVSDPTIRVRGLSSINASNSPLIVVDGMPYNGYWNDLNTADIESITVLKDAASNALYGARGANGVILITTKSAKRGTTHINVDMKWGANTNGRIDYDKVNDPGQYYEAAYLGYKNYYMNAMGQSAAQAHISANQMIPRQGTDGGLGYMVYAVPEQQFLIGTNGRLNPNATLGNRVAYNGQIFTLLPDNWLEEGTRNGLRQEYNVSVQGGNDQFSILASLGHLENEGLSYNSDLRRTSARLKVDYKLYDFLRMGANAGYNHLVTNQSSGVFGAAYNVAPIYPLYMRDGSGAIMQDVRGNRYDYGAGENGGMYRSTELNTNPLQADKLDINNNVSHAFNIQGYITADFLKHFSFTANANIYITNNQIKTGVNPYYGFDVNTGGSVSSAMYKTTSSNFQQLLNYDQSFGAHTVSVLLGHEYSREANANLYGYKTRVAMYTANTELDGAIIDGSVSGSSGLYNVEGIFLRGQYDYDNRYFASASFRRDGSSRFAKGHQWGNFWSLGGAWIISREEWFPKTWAVNMLKFKASYGEQGNDGIGNYFYTDFYKIVNSNNQVAYTFSNKGNRNITWETVGAFNTGFEFELLNSRLNGGIEFYSRTTRDMLMWFSTPLSLGYSGYYSNIGDRRNTGVEVELNGDIIRTKDVTWNLSLNLSWQRNRVVSLPSETAQYSVDGHAGYLYGEYYIGEGLPLYTWYMKKFAGVSENGESLYYHTDADGNMVASTDYSNADYYLCGSALPTVFGGFSTTLNAYGFDLSATFNYSIGGKKYDSAYQNLMTPPHDGVTGHAVHQDLFKGWTAEAPNPEIPRWQYNDLYTSNFCDRFLTDASYLSLKNITLGYTLPKNLTRRFYVDNLRVYFTCENIYYWSHRKGFDPRVDMGYGSYGGIPPMRSFTGGLQIRF